MGSSALEPSVARHLAEASPCKVLIACSGGADSVFMLCILSAKAKELGLELYLAHYNHRWRGDESTADAAFVASLAEAFGLPFSCEERPSGEAAFTETTARALRLDFLRKVADEYACDYILFGHQLDDIIETQLQRIARGCASDGLAAPRPIALFEGRPTHLRPILHLRAGDIRMALNATSIPWREDLSNDDVSIARNALRKSIVPELSESLGRDAPVGAARSRRLLEEDADALDTLARVKLPEAFQHEPSLNREKLRSIPVALMRRALADWLSGHGLIASVSAPAMDILIETLLSERDRFRMSAGEDYILLNSQMLSLERGDEAGASRSALKKATLESGEPIFLSNGALIQIDPIEVDVALLGRLSSGQVDPGNEAVIADMGDEAFTVRSWQPGDRFCPLGAPGTKKLKDWFIDRRIPQAERKLLPIVINASNEVIWVPGFPPAESCKIQPSTKRALRLTYQARKPL
jgi:tRNA(Ile)-lysidine synthase